MSQSVEEKKKGRLKKKKNVAEIEAPKKRSNSSAKETSISDTQ